MIKEVYSEKETRDFAYEMAQKAEVGQVYCLDGDLGVGKTVFTKGFAEGLGIDDDITSPTFTIVNEYHSGRIPFYHFDVYRIGDEDEMFDIGFDEYVDGNGVCLIERVLYLKMQYQLKLLRICQRVLTIEKLRWKNENFST